MNHYLLAQYSVLAVVPAPTSWELSNDGAPRAPKAEPRSADFA